MAGGINYAPKTFTAGSPLLASELNIEVRDFSAGVQGVWVAFTPSRQNFSLGNGTEVARYIRFGDTIMYRYRLTWGSTTGGSGRLGIGLPINQHGSYIAHDPFGVGSLYDTSAGFSSRTPATAVHDGSGAIFFVTASGSVSDGFPWTWATGDTLSFTGTYEAA